MIIVPEQVEMAIYIAFRTALAISRERRCKSHNNSLDVHEKKLNGKYSRHNVAYHMPLMFILPKQFQVISK